MSRYVPLPPAHPTRRLSGGGPSLYQMVAGSRFSLTLRRADGSLWRLRRSHSRSRAVNRGSPSRQRGGASVCTFGDDMRLVLARLPDQERAPSRRYGALAARRPMAFCPWVLCVAVLLGVRGGS